MSKPIAELLKAERSTNKAVSRLLRLLGDMTDPEPCWFDHNGGNEYAEKRASATSTERES